MRFTGSYVALLTPFDLKGRVDRKAIEKLVEWHIAEKTDGIVCSATTGEGATLSENERKKIEEICIKTAAGRIPIIAATGTNDTRASVRYTETALKLGAKGCLAVTPYYNKPSNQGCLLHFAEIAKVGLPVIVYHNPPRAVVRLTVETVEALGKIPNIVGFKDSSHDLEFVRKIVPHIAVLSGDDDVTFDILKAGGVGAIATVANLVPRGWNRMVKACLEGRWEEAKALSDRYLPLIKTIFLETNPQCHKFALSWLGRCKPVLRLPMILPPEKTKAEIKKAILRLCLPQFHSYAVQCK
ncbi:MAG: 4-hydroxy-tetrahydrodipicolinate synthase [Parachlamydiales bacterium]|nr:4-hydroxy-tetrahydrodipicolinate synthase [Parachlamydiales bacterium]